MGNITSAFQHAGIFILLKTFLCQSTTSKSCQHACSLLVLVFSVSLYFILHFHIIILGPMISTVLTCWSDPIGPWAPYSAQVAYSFILIPAFLAVVAAFFDSCIGTTLKFLTVSEVRFVISSVTWSWLQDEMFFFYFFLVCCRVFPVLF